MNLCKVFDISFGRSLLQQLSRFVPRTSIYFQQQILNGKQQTCIQDKLLSTTSIHMKKLGSKGKFETNSSATEDVDEPEDEEKYQELVHRARLLPAQGHQVFVVQPYVKWGPNKKSITTPDLMLEEAVALVSCIPGWVCVKSAKISLMSLGKKRIFGSGNFENLAQEIRQDPNISAVFISTNVFRGPQRKELEDGFHVPIFDRYAIVLQIFKERAKTHEAKLQIALAEIPYLRSSLANLQFGAKGGPTKEGSGSASISGSGESYFEIQNQLLARREKKIKTEILKLESKRSVLKLQRERREIPSVAILGYTNCGKTTLIKTLTGASKLEPKDALFATLDVTSHACLLPCNLSTLLIDTVGFISDIPTTLIAAFNSTLRDAIDADLLVHLVDISHPDWPNQSQTVIATLESLNIGETRTVITVANKIDKATPDMLEKAHHLLPEDTMYISAVTGEGLQTFITEIQEKVIDVTDRLFLFFKVLNGCEEYSWLHKNAAVCHCQPLQDNFVILQTVITKSSFGKFKALYPHVKVGKVNK